MARNASYYTYVPIYTGCFRVARKDSTDRIRRNENQRASMNVSDRPISRETFDVFCKFLVRSYVYCGTTDGSPRARSLDDSGLIRALRPSSFSRVLSSPPVILKHSVRVRGAKVLEGIALPSTLRLFHHPLSTPTVGFAVHARDSFISDAAYKLRAAS